jgi:hypothetical protein
MSLSLAGVLADAGALWRRERELLLRVAGLFFVVPMLGIVLLLAGSGFPGDVPPEKMREALMAFYYGQSAADLRSSISRSNFGTFAMLNLYLQGGGRTLGEVLALALRRFVPWLVIDIVASLLFSFGSRWLLLPGLFAFARTWLAGRPLPRRPSAGCSKRSARDGGAAPASSG